LEGFIPVDINVSVEYNKNLNMIVINCLILVETNAKEKKIANMIVLCLVIRDLVLNANSKIMMFSVFVVKTNYLFHVDKL
jgi:hypothetical protein